LTKTGGPTTWPATSPDFTLLNFSCGAISKTGSMRLCGTTLLSFGLFAYKEQQPHESRANNNINSKSLYNLKHGAFSGPLESLTIL